MSRIGKLPIQIPAQVKLQVTGRTIQAEGPKGKLTLELPPRTQVTREGDQLLVNRDGEDKQARSMHGLGRALLFNMVQGVHTGYVRKLEIHGVGFKAAVQGNALSLALGYSHSIQYPIPDQVKVTVEDNTKITVEGPDRQVVGQVASEIRGFYPPEPYKGKGVRYSGEQIVRKEGKTVQ